jgi:hypothetical protein
LRHLTIRSFAPRVVRPLRILQHGSSVQRSDLVLFCRKQYGNGNGPKPSALSWSLELSVVTARKFRLVRQGFAEFRPRVPDQKSVGD